MHTQLLYIGPSYSRHVSYCRRSQSRPKVRRKSCRACCVAKAKCSFTTPCSRCTAKKLNCFYDHVNVTGNANLNTDSQIVCSPSGPLVSQRESSVPGFLGVNDDDPAIDLSDLPNVVQLPYDGTFGDNIEEVVFSDLIEESMSATEFLPHLTQYPYMTDDSFLDDMNSAKQLHFLTRLSPSKPLSQQGANLLLESLCAMPEQMLRKATFPMFIHPHWDPLIMPEALAVCMQIVRMFASRTPEVMPFVWRTILAEKRRYLEEVCTSFSLQQAQS